MHGALREVLHRAGWDVEGPTGAALVKSGVMDPAGELC
jgi:hypothetical protein